MARVTRMTKRRLGELLQAEGLVSEEQVRAGLEEQRRSMLFLGEALVKLGFVSEEVIAQTIAQQFSLPFMSANQYTITPEVINTFPERMYFEYQFVAADKIGRVLIIIGAGLMNHDVLDELERLSGCKVCQFVSTWKDIRAALDKHVKDLKKEQSSLTSLGTMLLDNSPIPKPIAKIEPPAALVGGGPSFAPGSSLVGSTRAAEAAAQSAPAPSIPRPGVPGGAGVNTVPRLGVSGSTNAIPRTSMPGIAASANMSASGSGHLAAVPRPTGGTIPGIPKLATAGPQSPRLSALASVRPPALKSGQSSGAMQAVPGASPPAPTPAPAHENNNGATDIKPAEPTPRPPAPQGKTGLLNLFKKQP